MHDVPEGGQATRKPVDALKALIRLAALKKVPYHDWEDEGPRSKSRRLSSSGADLKKGKSRLKAKTMKRFPALRRGFSKTKTSTAELLTVLAATVLGAVRRSPTASIPYSLPHDRNQYSEFTPGQTCHPQVPRVKYRQKTPCTEWRDLSLPVYKRRLLKATGDGSGTSISELLRNVSAKCLPAGAKLRPPGNGLQSVPGVQMEVQQAESDIRTELSFGSSVVGSDFRDTDSSLLTMCEPLVPQPPSEPPSPLEAPLHALDVASPLHREIVSQSICKLEDDGKLAEARLMMLDWCNMRQEPRTECTMHVMHRQHELLTIASDLLVDIGRPMPHVADPSLFIGHGPMEVQIQRIVSQQLRGRQPMFSQYKGDGIRRYVLKKI